MGRYLLLMCGISKSEKEKVSRERVVWHPAIKLQCACMYVVARATRNPALIGLRA